VLKDVGVLESEKVGQEVYYWVDCRQPGGHAARLGRYAGESLSAPPLTRVDLRSRHPPFSRWRFFKGWLVNGCKRFNI